MRQKELKELINKSIDKQIFKINPNKQLQIQKNQTDKLSVQKADSNFLLYNMLQFMQLQSKSSQQNLNQSKSQQSALSSTYKSSTLGNLIEQIHFQKKTKPIKKKAFSQTSSISSNQSVKSKEKSKLWTEQQNQKFLLLIKKHGPDFQTLGPFFEKKSKNQLKNKYKQYLINEKKKYKHSQSEKPHAVTVGSLFVLVDQKQEYP